MAADNPAEATGANSIADGESQAPVTGDALPLAALAVAADPAMALTLGGGALNHADDAGPVSPADAIAYDGHVALALDADALPGINSMLDLLVTSHDLFDIPSIDSVQPFDDSTPT